MHLSSPLFACATLIALTVAQTPTTTSLHFTSIPTSLVAGVPQTIGWAGGNGNVGPLLSDLDPTSWLIDVILTSEREYHPSTRACQRPQGCANLTNRIWSRRKFHHLDPSQVASRCRQLRVEDRSGRGFRQLFWHAAVIWRVLNLPHKCHRRTCIDFGLSCCNRLGHYFFALLNRLF